MSGKHIFVLWSGGADSTYTIQRCIESDEYDMVWAGYVLLENNLVKAQYELSAIDQMVPLFLASEKFGWLGVVLQVSLNRINRNVWWKQIPLWFYTMVAAVNVRVDEVAMGLNATDFEGPGSTLPVEDFRRLWAAYRPIYKEHQPEWVFPVIEHSAGELRARLRPELRALCVHCEEPVREGDTFKKCGTCPPCKKYG